MAAKKKHPTTRARRNKASTASTLRRITEESTPLGVYLAMTMTQLREAIDLRNAQRPADQQIPKKGSKAELAGLLAAAERQIPAMPPHPPRYDEDGWEIEVDWHAQTEAWWNDVWTSPMAAEWDDSDLHNVIVVALLYDDIWRAETAKQRKDALAEYRLQRADLGLSPYSRRRLEWTIETADEAKAKGERRRGTTAPTGKPAAKTGTKDPRAGLSVVN